MTHAYFIFAAIAGFAQAKQAVNLPTLTPANNRYEMAPQGLLLSIGDVVDKNRASVGLPFRPREDELFIFTFGGTNRFGMNLYPERLAQLLQTDRKSIPMEGPVIVDVTVRDATITIVQPTYYFHVGKHHFIKGKRYDELYSVASVISGRGFEFAASPELRTMVTERQVPGWAVSPEGNLRYTFEGSRPLLVQYRYIGSGSFPYSG